MTTSPPTPAAAATRVAPSWREAVRFWLKIGCLSFGGPAAQISLLQHELVDRRRWIAQGRFLNGLNFCMLLPGPEAQQLATYCGWLLHGVRGALVAGTLFVLPGAAVLWALALLYVTYGELDWVQGIFFGLKPAVLAIVVGAVRRIGRRALHTPARWVLAALAFAALFFASVPFPALIAAAAIVGALGSRVAQQQFVTAAAGGGPATAGIAATPGTPPSAIGAGRILGAGLPLWLGPTIAAGLALGFDHTLFREGVFFAKAALVTFGGAYAVLPYVAQKAVEVHGWVDAPQMLDSLALAETTPGPLILVLQFVGFLGAWAQPGHLPPLLAATLGAGLTTWTTFAPSFLFVLLGAPYIARLEQWPALAGALAAVTAAVVGVIVNLAVWFALPVLGWDHGQFDLAAAAILVAALFALERGRIGILPVIVACGAAGWAWSRWAGISG
jgi:chromate transporter